MNLMYDYIFLVKFRQLSGHLLGKSLLIRLTKCFHKYLIVNLVFSHLGFWSGNLSLVAPLPDHCLLLPLLTHSASILELSTSLFLKFYKSLLTLMRSYPTTILVWYCQFDVSSVNYSYTKTKGNTLVHMECTLLFTINLWK